MSVTTPSRSGYAFGPGRVNLLTAALRSVSEREAIEGRVKVSCPITPSFLEETTSSQPSVYQLLSIFVAYIFKPAIGRQ